MTAPNAAPLPAVNKGLAEYYNRIVESLMDHVEKGTTDQAQDVMEVPCNQYTDPATWQREIDQIFKRLPIMVALSVEIPEPGDFKTIEMMGLPLLVTRTREGEAKVMLNVCSHRGMKLTQQECGHARLFTCPYHRWSFGLDGALRGVAEHKTFGEVDKAALGLRQLACYERGGMIFAVLTPGLEVDFEDFLGGMIEDVEQKRFDQWHFCGKREIFGANWKIAYDGYLEGYHFASAHPETIYPRTYSNIMHFEAHGPHILIGFPQRSIGELRDVPRDELWQYETRGYDFIRTFFPNVSIFVAPEITQVAQLIPGPTAAENRTVLYFLKPKPPANEEEKAANETMMDWLQSVVDREDYQVGLQVQQGMESGAHRAVLFGRNERGNQHFHRYLSYYMNGDDSAPRPEL
ncbi:MAG: aromatic ring-hydroxylating oxygenase subunit alpha [Parahaliea sp.]